jgi:hypothetical protein
MEVNTQIEAIHQPQSEYSVFPPLSIFSFYEKTILQGSRLARSPNIKEFHESG